MLQLLSGDNPYSNESPPKLPGGGPKHLDRELRKIAQALKTVASDLKTVGLAIDVNAISISDLESAVGGLEEAVGDLAEAVEDLQIDSGSNSDGYWVKYPDGTMICTHWLSLGSRTASGAGTYADPYRANTVTWTFPVAFIATPIVQATAEKPAVGDVPNRLLAATVQSVTTTQAQSIRVTALSSGTNDGEVFANLTAVGRWK